MIMQTAQPSPNPNAPTVSASSPEQESREIIEAREKVRSLETRVKVAKAIVVIVLGLAAAIGFGIAWVSLRSDWINEDLRAAEKTLTTLETAKLKTDAQRDVDSARNEAKQRLETETKRVEGEAGKKIEEAKAEAGVKIEQARGDAEVKIAGAMRDTEEVRKQNLSTEARLEQERQTRLELEESIAPRIMEQHRSSEDLKRFAGAQVIIECINDFEARRMAGQLAVTLQMANWQLDGPWIVEEGEESRFFDGIDIETNAGPDDSARAIGAALAAQLEANKIRTTHHPAYPFLPPKTLRVKVGLKPIPYFSEKKLKEVLEDGRGAIFGNVLVPRKRPKMP